MMARTLILSLVGLLAIVSPVYLMFVAISDQSQLYQYSALPRARTSATIGDTRQNVMDQAFDILKLNSGATGLLKLQHTGQLAGNLRVNGYLQPLVGGFNHRLSPVLFHRSRPALPPGADTVMMR